MGIKWSEVAEGILFKNPANMDECMLARLEMLISDNLAFENKDDDTIFIPHEVIVLLSDEDCELLKLPEKNPYQLFIRADGDLGHKDLYYFIEVMQSSGRPFINPRFNGSFLHISSEINYRVTMEQYQMISLIENSNSKIKDLERQQITGFNLGNLGKLQKFAKRAQSRLDNVLSEDNNKIVMLDKIDVDFEISADGKLNAKPIILQENEQGHLKSVDIEGFQEAFKNRAKVKDVYNGKNRTKIVCSPEVQDALKQIKDVKGINPDDKERFTKQPKELFSGDAFVFDSGRIEDDFVNDEVKDDIEEKEELWLPEEASFIDEEYSKRVKGLAEIQRTVYYGSGHKTGGWLPTEEELAKSLVDSTSEDIGEVKDDDCVEQNNDEVINEDQEENDNNLKEDSVGDPSGLDVNKPVQEKDDNSPKALDIIDNFEYIGYNPDEIKREGSLDCSALKKGINLLSYQEAGVSWMFNVWRYGLQGVLLADDMGLGKTLQTLAFIAEVKKGSLNNEEIKKPVLIVAPTALLKNWEAEYEKFIERGIFGEVIKLHGATIRNFETGEITPNKKRKLELKLKSNSLALTTYETLRDYQFSFAEVSWGIIIADEAQKIKNPSTGVTKAIKSMKYDYAICLSGTPVENSWIDLWSIMDFVQPANKLGDLKQFKDKYISRLNDVDGNQEAIETLGMNLKEGLIPHFMRRMKKDKLEGIPKKEIHKCLCEMPDYQKKCYISVIELAKKSEIHPLQMIAKLRDISLHPDLGSKQIESFFEADIDKIINRSARLIKVFEILKDIQKRNEKALIFLVSKKMQLILKHLLNKEFGLNVANPVNGEMNGTARQMIINKFNNSDGFNVLILSPEAAGVGFTITSANNVIHLSRTWNPAKEDQATDRVYRIGQKKDVHVYLPIAYHESFGKGGSFDEKLDELLDYKRVLSENVLFPTGDGTKDGMKIFNDLTNTQTDKLSGYNWSIEDVDTVVGDIFEQIITKLYNEMPDYKAEKTPQSNDYGVDVVVCEKPGKQGYLIQCKHKGDYAQPVGNRGVQEVYSAIQYYKSKYPNIEFTPVVVTNAERFSSGACELANKNGVKLIARNELRQMLEKYPVLKDC